MSFDEFLPIFSLIGMIAGVWGAYRLYTADRPTSGWIIDLFRSVAEKPSRGVLASNDYDPQAEKATAMARAQEIARAVDTFDAQARSGIGWVFSGFAIQALSTLLEILLKCLEL